MDLHAGWTHRTTPLNSAILTFHPHTTIPSLIAALARHGEPQQPPQPREQPGAGHAVRRSPDAPRHAPSRPLSVPADLIARLQAQHAQQQSSSSPSPPPPNTMAYERAAAESNYYAQTDIVMRPHEPHPDCPDTLACLPDTNGRPQHTLPVILRCAILGSPKKRLTIREIYAAMEKKYPYYKTAGPAWKVCAPCPPFRDFLTLTPAFRRRSIAIRAASFVLEPSL